MNDHPQPQTITNPVSFPRTLYPSLQSWGWGTRAYQGNGKCLTIPADCETLVRCAPFCRLLSPLQQKRKKIFSALYRRCRSGPGPPTALRTSSCVRAATPAWCTTPPCCTPLSSCLLHRLSPGYLPSLPLQVRNNAGGLWNHGLFFLHNLAPAGSQASARGRAASQGRVGTRAAGGGLAGRHTQ